MSIELNNEDYQFILNFYNKPLPRSNRLLKINAEKILTTKLCRCIKKLERPLGPRSVGICTKSIINKKGFKRKGKFTCKKRWSRIKLSKPIQGGKTKKNNK